MTKDQHWLLKEVNYSQYLYIESELEDNYKQSSKVEFADTITTGLYFLGFIIGVTIFQSIIVLAQSGKRNYKWNWLISLLGLNPFFFLYIGEQARYSKYYKESIEKKDTPIFLKKYQEGIERFNNLDSNKLYEMKRNSLFSVEYLPDKKYKTIGYMSGSNVRAKNAVTDISSSVKSIKGGEIKKYIHLLKDTRNRAVDDLIKNTVIEYEDFDAIIGLKFTTSEIGKGMSEIMAFGTVIKYKK